MTGGGHLAKALAGAYGRSAMDGPLFMDAVITPNRSLTPRGLVTLILTITALDGVLAMVFVMMGAATIPIFIGIGLLAIVMALIVSQRAGKLSERIQVSTAEVRVMRESVRGGRLVWASPTAFTRVSLAGDDDKGELQLRLSGRELSVAAALSRGERRDFARALERAIARARSGQFDPDQ